MGIAQDNTRIGAVADSGSITGFTDGVDFEGTDKTIKGVNASNNGNRGINLVRAGNRLIGNTTNNNGGAGIVVVTCPNLLLENIANGNHNLNDIVEEPAGCNDVRQENFPAP